MSSPLDSNFQDLLCQDGKNPAELCKPKRTKKRVTFAPMEKEDYLQGENTKDMNNAENGQFSFQKDRAISELEEDAELENRFTITTLLPPLPSLSRKKVGQQKSNDKKLSFVSMNKKKEQGFDMETEKPKKRFHSFLKARPTSSQESDVKREVPPSPILLSCMGDEIPTDISSGSECEIDLESNSEKPASPVSSEAFNQFQDELEKFEREQEEPLEAESKDRLVSLQEKRQAEERRMNEETAKEVKQLQETPKADQKRQERKIRQENNAIPEIKSSLLGPLLSLDTNFRGRLCQDGKNPAEFRKRKCKKKHFTLEKKESMEKKEQGFDMETAKPENRPGSFLKARPKSSQQSDVKREETSEDDGLDLFESMNVHIDIADLADVLHEEVHTDLGSASEPEMICQASSPQHDQTDHEAGLDSLNASLDQSYEESLNLQSNNGALVCDPLEGFVSHEESSELGISVEVRYESDFESDSEILTDTGTESRCDTNFESNSERPEPTATSPVCSEAFNKFQDSLEKFEMEEEERLEAECKDRLVSLHLSLLEIREGEEKRMKEESAKELVDLQETLKAYRERQEREIQEENYAILEKVKTELKEEVAKTVQKLKARKKKGLDHLQAQLEFELTSEKEKLQTLKAKQQDSLMRESRESFTSKHQEVKQEQRRTLERLSEDHEKEIRKLREKHSKDKAFLKEQLLSRFNQEKEESAKELEKLQETLKVDRERQALEIRKENVAILEKMKNELKEELAKTVEKLKARKKKQLDHLKAELEEELTSEKESVTSVREEVEQEQKRTLERLREDHEKEIRKLQKDNDLVKEQLLSRFNQEKEESAKELGELRDNLKEDRKRQEREIREENVALLDKVKTELKEEVAKTVQNLKACKKKRLDHLEAELEVELKSEKDRLQTLKAKQQDSLMQESRESFTFIHQEVEQEQRHTLERLSEDHEKEIRKLREKHSEKKDLLKEKLLSRFNQEKAQREECLALRLQELNFQHEAEVLKRQRENSDKMLELKELPTELEVSQDAEFKAKVERLSQRTSYLEEKDRRKKFEAEKITVKEEVEREHLYVTSGCRCDVSLDLLEKTNEELRTCRQERENLVTMVDQLQRQYDRLSSRMNQFETSSLRSDVKYSSRFSEEPDYVGSPPLSGHVDVHQRTTLFLKLEAERLERENSRWRESQTPSVMFLSSWSKYRTENAHSGIADLSSRGYNY